MEAEYRKLLSRNDELTKQEATLKKEYTTLLRKISSLSCVLTHIESNFQNVEEPKLISENSLKRVPALKWYNEQISLIRSLTQMDGSTSMVIPDELVDSYKLYKDTPLLHTDIQ